MDWIKRALINGADGGGEGVRWISVIILAGHSLYIGAVYCIQKEALGSVGARFETGLFSFLHKQLPWRRRLGTALFLAYTFSSAAPCKTTTSVCPSKYNLWYIYLWATRNMFVVFAALWLLGVLWWNEWASLCSLEKPAFLFSMTANC